MKDECKCGGSCLDSTDPRFEELKKYIDSSCGTNLGIEADGDYCTLVTCTPYGVNSHRLLVRGVRDTQKE